jgi:predicted O-methyltransferase YrrM
MQKIKNIIKSILALIYFPWLVAKARKKIIKSRQEINSAEEAFNWTEKFYVGARIRGLDINFKAAQIKEEILGLLNELEKNPPRLILEIGTATGGTLFMLSQIATDDAEIFSIDLPLGPYGAGYFKYKISLFKAFTKNQQKINLLRTDSHRTETVDQIKEMLNGRHLDFLFIDGDHTYEGVKNDFELYSSLVRPQGIIAFHDIVKNNFDSSFGVHKFWQEIKIKYQHQEFISPLNHGCAGIGMIKII